jgi:hypothetical protein
MNLHSGFFSFSKLEQSQGASTVIRIAMVCNDLATANSSLRDSRNIESSTMSHIRQGASLYFVRMSCGHLREGVKAVKAVREDSYLNGLVEKCEPEAQEAFAHLCECLPGGKDYQDFVTFVQSVRNKAGFHYDFNQINTALHDRVTRPTASPICSITIGEDLHSSRLEFADALVDTVVCRNLWKIQDADGTAEANRISNWCFQKSVEYLRFGGEFVLRYMLRHAVTAS